MIYTTKILEETILEDESIELEELLCTENYNIIFGNYESINESFSIRKDALTVLIRNRQRDGVKGEPIPHEECTVKLIKDSYPMYEGMKGLPFTINDPVELYKNANNDRNRKAVSKKDFEFLKEVIDNHYLEIKRYWEADPDTIKGQQTLKKVEREMIKKYNKDKGDK